MVFLRAFPLEQRVPVLFDEGDVCVEEADERVHPFGVVFFVHFKDFVAVVGQAEVHFFEVFFHVFCVFEAEWAEEGDWIED